ncbi:MAG TPA: hypothetical protein VGH76_14455 [Actinomycetospora sp.]|uniref:hypothetical protein n=1 Tax=Actinomycetospora sp. TaxID=1872135 RepID=UPI002F420B9C
MRRPLGRRLRRVVVGLLVGPHRRARAHGGSRRSGGPVPAAARSTARPASCTSNRWASRRAIAASGAKDTRRGAPRMPATALRQVTRAADRLVPVAASGFQRPWAASSSRSATASSRWASRPSSRPASSSGATFSGRPAGTAVWASADPTAASVGAVTASTAAPGVVSLITRRRPGAPPCA